MTWVKTGDEFPDDCAGLSDAAYRTHHEGLHWVMRRLTAGCITPRDLRRFAETEDAFAAVDELIAAGFWKPTDNGWLILAHMNDQQTPDEVVRRRALSAERSKRYRAKQLERQEKGEQR